MEERGEPLPGATGDSITRNRHKVTGQLLLRNAGTRFGGRRIVYGVCILAVPDDFEIEDHHQYLVHGTSEGRSAIVAIIGGAQGEDRSEYKDVAPTELLQLPIWRV